MKKVLVTGATGFVGANLTRRLLLDGYAVDLIVRAGHKPWRLSDVIKNLPVHEVDLDDRTVLFDLLRKVRPDWIFHLAVHGAYSSQTDLQEMVRTNFVGTINLVEAALAAGFEAFINTGSSSEYGFKTEAPSEKSWVEPNSHYAVTKAAATQFCRYTAQSKNVRMHTLRLYSVFGPWEEPTRLIPTLIRLGLDGKLPPLVDPDIARDYIYVDDVVNAYLTVATKQGQDVGAVYNVGTGIQTTVKEVVEITRRALSVVAEPTWGSMKNRIWDSSSWVSDIRAIKETCGWSPNFSFEDGFRSTIEWTKHNSTKLKQY